MARIHERNGKLPRPIRDGDILLLLLFIVIAVLPVALVDILTIDVDETHMLIKDWLEIDLKWKWEHAPLLIGLTFGASSAATVIFFGLVLPLLYMATIFSNFESLRPTCIFIDRSKILQNMPNHLLIQTKGFGTLSESKYIKILRTEGVLNRMLTGVYRSIWISSHHLCCLVVFVVVSFLAIREGNMLVREGVLIILVVAKLAILGYFSVVLWN